MRQSTEKLAVLLLVAASAAFHAATLPWQSLFVDEASQLLQARGTIAEVALRRDSMPPTYLLTLRGWVEAFGEGRGARWLSALASLATVPVVWRVGRRAASADGDHSPARGVGVGAAAVFAAAPMQLYYAQLIRGYALTTLAAALAILAYLRVVERGDARRWAAFAAAGVVGMWVHYYFATVLLVLLADLLLRPGLRRRRAPWLAAAAIVLGCLPLTPFLRADFQYQRELRSPRPFGAAAAVYTGLSFFGGYTLGVSKAELHEVTAAEAAAATAPWLAAVVAAASPLLWLGGRRLAQAGSLRVVALLALAPAPALGLIGTATGITYNPRFVAWCVAPLAVWLGAGIIGGLAAGGVRRVVTVAATTLLATVFATAIVNRHTVDRFQNEDLGGAVARLAEHADGEPVFILSDYLAPTLELHAQIDARRLPRAMELPSPGQIDVVADSPRHAADALAAVESVGGPFWLVECRAFHGDPERIVRDALSKTYRLEVAARMPGVTVYRGDRRP